MAKDKENIFAFDISPFVQGIQKISKGIGVLQNNAANMAKSVSKGIVNATVKIGLLAGGFKLIRGAIKEMPEIGQTFGIAKNIITKNLLFPLRKALFPLLQKFLNWVRDNRAMFIKWGQTLADVFNVVVDAVGNVIDAGQKMFNTFLGFVGKIFGTNIKSLQDLLNILTFRFAVIIEFVKALSVPIEHIFNRISDIVAGALSGGFKVLQSFVGGFLSGLGGIEGVINTILELVENVLSNLKSVTKEGSSIFSIFSSIGELYGKIVNWIVQMGKSLVEGFLPHLDPIKNAVQKIMDAFHGVFDAIFGSSEAMAGWSDMFGEIGSIVGGVLTNAFSFLADIINGITDAVKWLTGGGFDWITSGGMTKEIIKSMENKNSFDDVIVTNDGRIIPVNSNDDIMAFKPGGPIENVLGGNQTTNKSQINIDFRGMQVIIQDTSEAEAERAAETIVEAFRAQLTRELERGGVK